MIQITPQMRVLVATESVDGRKGIDSLGHSISAAFEVSIEFEVI